MKSNKIGVVLSVAMGVVGLCAGARTFEVTVWKGETTAVRIPDFVELESAPVGILLKTGVLKSVKYAPDPYSLHRTEVFDRVEWGGKSGPRVAQITASCVAKPGTYDCGMMRVKVLDRELPPAKDWKYHLDLWQHPWAVARMSGSRPFSASHYRAMKPVWELLATAGQKTITVTMLEQPWDHQCRDAYHSFFPNDDFKLFDEYVEFCLGCGLGPYISCYSLCPWNLKEKIGSPEFEKRWGTFLEKFAAHLKEKGWFGQTFMSMDERTPDDVRAVAEFVQKHAPGMKISMAGNRKPSDFKGITIDAYAQILMADCMTPEFLKEAAERRAKGFITTHYVCCAPVYPNTFMSSGDGEAFWNGVYPAVAGLDGFLRWAWNSWPEDPVVDASYGDWRAGDTFLCYPDGEPSWRFMELRNGIVAAEKLRIMKEKKQVSDEELKSLAPLFDVKSANENKLEFWRARQEVQKLVNK